MAMTDEDLILIPFDSDRSGPELHIGNFTDPEYEDWYFRLSSGGDVYEWKPIHSQDHHPPKGLFIAGDCQPDQIGEMNAALSVHEAEAGLPDGGLRLALKIADARGLVAIERLVRSSPRFTWIGIDPLAVAMDLGVAVDALPIVVAKANIVIAARAARIGAFEIIPDALFNNMRRRQSAADGFSAIVTSAALKGQSV